MGRLGPFACLVLFVLILSNTACEAAEAAPEVPSTQEVSLNCPVSEAEREYVNTLFAILGESGRAYGRMAGHVNLASSDSGLTLNEEFMQDEDWKWELGDWLVILLEQAALARQLEPPETLTHIHGRAIQLANDSSTIATNLAVGIDRWDQSYIDRASAAFVPFEEHLGKTFSDIGNYCRKAADLVDPQTVAITLSGYTLQQQSQIVAECVQNSPNFASALGRVIALPPNVEGAAVTLTDAVFLGIFAPRDIYEFAVACETGVIDSIDFGP